MRVCISVGGRFHAFYLAQQLQSHRQLERLITSYPRSEVARYGIDKERVLSLVSTEIVRRLHNRLPTRLQYGAAPVALPSWFDRQAAARLPECDICTAWSGMGLRTIRVAKKRGAMTVIERCSSHIEYQRDILKDEYARFGLDIEPVPAGIVERELEEYAEADYIAIPSQFVKRSFLERGVPAEKLIHTPYGVDLLAFRPLRKVDNVFRVINVGAQSIRKGTIYLIQAFAELKLPNAELVLIGPVSEELRPLVAPYEGSFRFLGAVPQEQLIHHYAQADVFALCSVEEGLAYVQPQAMACGLPVICTTNTGGEDIVRDGVDGFVIPIRDVALLKDKISFFYENRQACSEMGNSALERVRSGLSWGDYGQRVVDAYQARLSPKRRIQPPPYTVV